MRNGTETVIVYGLIRAVYFVANNSNTRDARSHAIDIFCVI